MIALARWIAQNLEIVWFALLMVVGWVVAGFLTLLLLRFTKFWNERDDEDGQD